jgi:fibronectin type 3 domain-containing protein
MWSSFDGSFVFNRQLEKAVVVRKKHATDRLESAIGPVIENLEDRTLLYGDTTTVQTLPFSLNFTSAVAGTIADKSGLGTGFTLVQPNKNANEYQPALLNLQTSSGLLDITTTGTSTAGGTWEGDNSLVDGVETQFNATTGAFAMTTRLKGPLSYIATPSDQGGIFFGPDDDNYVKFVAGTGTGSGDMLQFVDEQKPAGATTYTHAIATANSFVNIGSFASINTLDLQIQGDPSTGIITGAYSVNGGTFTKIAQSVTLSGTEKSAFFSTAARAGLIAMAKNNLAPITVGFDNFSIDATTTNTSSGSGALTGTVIGTAGSFQNQGAVIANAFDGSLNSYVDGPTPNGVWMGLNFGSLQTIAQIRYSPRSQFESRMKGGIFQGSTTPDFSSGVTNLYTITTTPVAGAYTQVAIAGSPAFQYVRYLSPNGSYGDVAEIEFDNAVTTLQSPSVSDSNPVNGAAGVARTAFVSCDLNLPNGAGIDPDSMIYSTVYLYRTFDKLAITAELNTDAAGSVVILQPDEPLDASTNYTFVITSGLEDTNGGAFTPFQISFTTGSAAIPSDPNIAFQQVPLPTAMNQPFTGVTVGPDGDLYAPTENGDIFQFPINPDGSLGTPTDIKTVITGSGGPSLITGIAFDPSSTWNPVTKTGNLIMWVSHGAAGVLGAADWTGKISTLSGPNFSIYTDYITGLPRSFQNHLNNQPSFGPDGALYFAQGSNSAMGAADPVWGNRPEHLLNAAILRLDVGAVEQYVATNHQPLDVQTDSLPVGQTPYNPYTGNPLTSPLTIYATGVRNAFDMVWNSNGQLYVPVNGSAANGNIPGTPPGVTPSAPALNDVPQAEDDFMIDVSQGGYYGHPNPTRGEYIFDGGNPTNPQPNTIIEGSYPLGTNPDPNYRGIAWDFGVHYSVDGIIQYHGSAFNGALDGAMLAVRYSGGKDIIVLRTDSSGNIISEETGIAGFSGFDGPVDLIEDPRTGDIYVANLDGGYLTLLRPVNYGATASVSTSSLVFNGVVGSSPTAAQTITLSNTGSAPLAIGAGEFSLLGTDGALFGVTFGAVLPTVIAPGGSIPISVSFLPKFATVGLHTTQLQIQTNDQLNPTITISLGALATAGTGSAKSPSLQQILNLYQIPDNVGSSNPSNPQLVLPVQTPNDEVVMQRLMKAGTGPVTITPIAVFGPNITPSAAIGYYTPGTTDSKTSLFTVNAANSQTVVPNISGVTSFDPGSAIFGLFAAIDQSPNTSTSATRYAYSEDVLNTFDTSGNTRKIRFYPLKTSAGAIVPNAYIFAVEANSAAPYYFNDVVGIIRNVTAAPSGAEIGTQNSDAVPFPDRLVFNSITNKNSTFPDKLHNTDVLRINNTGTGTLSISSIVSSSPAFTVLGNLTYPLTIAAGSFLNISVQYAPTDTGNTALNSGTLTINSNALNSPVKTIQLAGIWQSYSAVTPGSVSTAPTLPQIISTLGYTTNIVNSNQSLNQGGAIQTAGEEVLSGYWQAADTNVPVTVRQLAAYHTPGTSSSIYWFSQTTPGTFTSLTSTAADDSQAILPLSNDTTLATASAVFRPAAVPFGFNVDKLVSSVDASNPASAHLMRFWPARDRSGNIIANTWIMAMDYSGGSFTYTQNVYLIQNMKPAVPATPTNLKFTGSNSGVIIGWTSVTDPLLAGYNIYRSTSSTGPFVKLNVALITTTSYLDTTGVVGTKYYYQVDAIDVWNGASTFTAAASATRPKNSTAPAKPAGLVATPSNNGVTLTWTANTEPDLAGYNVYRSNSATGTFYELNTSPITTTTFLDTTATGGVISYYQVKAVNASGTLSTAATANTTRTIDTTPPAIPTGLKATGSTTGIALTWSANTETDLAGYNLYRSTSATGTFVKVNGVPITALLYNDYHAPNGVTSYYRLTAVNTSGYESSFISANALEINPNAPAAPANLTATSGTSGITLTWSANTETDLTGYNVYRAASASGPFTKLNTSLLTTPTYLDTTATVGVVSYYRVTAVNQSAKESTPATTSATRGTTGPSQPTGFTATAGATGIALKWNANSPTNLAGYNVLRSTSASGPFTKLNTSLITITTYTDSTEPTGVINYYELIAVDTSNNQSAPATANALAFPAQPTLFIASAGAGGNTLTWKANTEPDLAGYNVYRAAALAGPYTKLNTTPITLLTYLDTGATTGTIAFYQLTAVDTSSNQSSPAIASTLTFPKQPTGFSATASTSGVTLKWNANTETDLAGYNVYRATSAAGPFTKLNASPITVLTYADSTAPTGAIAYYQLTAVDTSSDQSAPAVANTLVFPAQPKNFTAVGGTLGITLQWSANTETDLAGYNVYRAASAAGPFTKLNATPITTLTYLDGTAPTGAIAYYQLTAVDTSANQSTVATANALAFPAQPKNFTATGGTSGITLQWSANTEADIAGYNVYRSASASGPFTKLNTTPITLLTYLDTTAPTGTISYYQLTAVDTSANQSAPATANALAFPAQPQNFIATGGTSSITLTWNANTEPDLAGYNLYSSASASGPFTKLNTTPITALTYTDTTAPSGQTTYYQLTAVDTSNNESTPVSANAAVSSMVAFASADIGNPTPAGNTTVITTGSAYNVQAGGFNIDGTSDQFRFVYEQLTGNFDIRVQITALSQVGGGTSSYARAGLMARASLDANAANVFSYDTPGPQGFLYSYRLTPGATTTHIQGPANGSAKWVRLVRSGNTYTSYASTDGTTWTNMGSITASLGTTIYVGMAATSHQTTALLNADFASFTKM